jgi:hypothetical protein
LLHGWPDQLERSNQEYRFPKFHGDGKPPGMSFDIGISGQYFYPVSISSHTSFAKTQMTPKELFFIGFKRSCLVHNLVKPMFS